MICFGGVPALWRQSRCPCMHDRLIGFPGWPWVPDCLCLGAASLATEGVFIWRLPKPQANSLVLVGQSKFAPSTKGLGSGMLFWAQWTRVCDGTGHLVLDLDLDLGAGTKSKVRDEDDESGDENFNLQLHLSHSWQHTASLRQSAAAICVPNTSDSRHHDLTTCTVLVPQVSLSTTSTEYMT